MVVYVLDVMGVEVLVVLELLGLLEVCTVVLLEL